MLRTDISSQITSSLVAKLSDPNWKNRKAGLEDIEAILSEAGNRIQANTGELMSALKGITKDSNGNLVATGIRLMGKIATAMGKAIDRQGRPMLSPCLMCISDTKTLVSQMFISLQFQPLIEQSLPSVSCQVLKRQADKSLDIAFPELVFSIGAWVFRSEQQLSKCLQLGQLQQECRQLCLSWQQQLQGQNAVQMGRLSL